MTLENLYAVGRVLDVPLAVLVADGGGAPIDERTVAMNRILNILRQQPEGDVADLLTVVQRVLDIKARAKRALGFKAKPPNA